MHTIRVHWESSKIDDVQSFSVTKLIEFVRIVLTFFPFSSSLLCLNHIQYGHSVTLRLMERSVQKHACFCDFNERIISRLENLEMANYRKLI